MFVETQKILTHLFLMIADPKYFPNLLNVYLSGNIHFWVDFLKNPQYAEQCETRMLQLWSLISYNML